MSDWKWYAGPGRSPEIFGVVEDTREAVIASARRDYGTQDGFTICEARKGTMKPYLPTAESIIETLCENADDNSAFGEDSAFDSWKGTAAAEEDLNATLAAWFDRHVASFPEPWVFAETRNEEFFAGEAQVEAIVEQSGLPEHVVRKSLEAAQ